MYGTVSAASFQFLEEQIDKLWKNHSIKTDTTVPPLSWIVKLRRLNKTGLNKKRSNNIRGRNA